MSSSVFFHVGSTLLSKCSLQGDTVSLRDTSAEEFSGTDNSMQIDFLYHLIVSHERIHCGSSRGLGVDQMKMGKCSHTRKLQDKEDGMRRKINIYFRRRCEVKVDREAETGRKAPDRISSSGSCKNKAGSAGCDSALGKRNRMMHKFSTTSSQVGRPQNIEKS